MEHSTIYFDLVTSISSLLLIAILLYLVARKTKSIPYPVLFVLAGLGLSQVDANIFKVDFFQPGLILFILLPILLFESSFNFDFRVFKKIVSPAFLLASAGLFLSSVLVAIPLLWMFEMRTLEALLFGVVISSTDPVAVLSILKKIGVPMKLNLLIDAESFFNDGTSLVLFKIISLILLSPIATGSHGSIISSALIDFVYITFGGLLFGFITGLICSLIIGSIKDSSFAEIGLTIITALLSFAIGEEVFKVSGVLSVLVAGLVVGNFGRSKISPQVYDKLVTIWEFLVFVITAIVFIMLGINVQLADLSKLALPVIAIVAVVQIARSIAVYTIGGMYNTFVPANMKVPFNWLHIVNWGGLKGVLPLTLLLTLPDNFAQKELFIELAYAVVLFTLIFNALTIKFLASALHLDKIDKNDRMEIILVEILIIRKLLKHLDWMLQIKEVSNSVYEVQRKKTIKQLNLLSAKFKKYTKTFESKELHTLTQNTLRKYCLNLEKKIYRELFEKQVISEPIYSKLAAKLDNQAELIDDKHDQFKELSSIDIKGLKRGKDLQVFDYLHDLLLGNSIDTVEEYYMYHKARFLGNEYVVHELDGLLKEQLELFSVEEINEVRAIYAGLMKKNETTLEDVEKMHKNICSTVSNGFCAAETKQLVEKIVNTYSREGRVSQKALQNLSIRF